MATPNELRQYIEDQRRARAEAMCALKLAVADLEAGKLGAVRCQKFARQISRIDLNITKAEVALYRPDLWAIEKGNVVAL